MASTAEDPHPDIAFGDVVPPQKGEEWSLLRCPGQSPTASFNLP
jgi:hypothetical protein